MHTYLYHIMSLLCADYSYSYFDGIVIFNYISNFLSFKLASFRICGVALNYLELAVH